MLYDDNEEVPWSTLVYILTAMIIILGLTGTALFYAGKYLLSFL